MFDLLAPYLPLLRAAAARASRVPDEADDLLQDALLEALRAGRSDLSQIVNQRWVLGTIRNLGLMTARGAARRRRRDTQYALEQSIPQQGTTLPAHAANQPLRDWLDALPPSLRRVAELAVAGHDRQEIAWLLGIGQVTLRQRIAALRRRVAEREADLREVTSTELATSDLSLRLGLIRRALLPVVRARHAAGVHDPDGHLPLLAGHRPRAE
jgi:RNA polymerase sigma-70 factor (ECF subfamily)